MKNLLKRISATLLVLLMVFSVLVGVIPADTAAASYTYNTGTRHDYNVSLSAQAQAYYTGDYTWDNLSNLNGGNENCLDMNNPLFQALHNLMSTTMTNSVSYKSLPDYWKYTDASGGSAGTIWFYADYTGSGSMSREHVWPKSHASFNEKNGGADLHHLRPSISTINSSRGNLIMGNAKNSGGTAWSYNDEVVLYRTSSLCEVNDNIKGDVARIFLYVWCRWEEPNLFKNTPDPVIGPNDSQNDGGKVIESLDTLLEWCEIDPVDTWEMSRNDQVQNVQGNRNVFIDYPEFAWLVFGRDVPTDLDTPSNNAAGGITGKPTEGTGTGSGDNTGSTDGNSGSSGGTTVPADSNYEKVTTLNSGDKVVIVAPAHTKALSMTKTSYYNAGVDVSGGFGSITEDEVFTVTRNGDGTYSFVSASGKTLALADDYNSLNDTGSNKNWELSDAGSGLFYLRNTGRDLYLEWYASKGNWSTYNPGAGSLTEDYELAFYKLTASSDGGSSGGSTDGNSGASSGGSTGSSGSNSGSSSGSSTGGSAGGNSGSTGSSYADGSYSKVTSVNTGDKVIIINPAYYVALSTVKTGYYNVGVDVSEGFQGITAAEVFTVTRNADGSYTFVTDDGKKLALAAEYGSLDESGENDTWVLTALDGGTFNLKNVGRGNYLEWYAEKENWSTYDPDTLDKQYALEFYKLAGSGGSTDSTDTTEPSQEPTQPETQEPTQTPTQGTTELPDASEPTPTTPNDGAAEEKDGTWIWIVVAVVVVLAAGGTCYYILVIRPKRGAAVSAEEGSAAPAEEETPVPAEEGSAAPAEEETPVPAEEGSAAPAEEETPAPAEEEAEPAKEEGNGQ